MQKTTSSSTTRLFVDKKKRTLNSSFFLNLKKQGQEIQHCELYGEFSNSSNIEQMTFVDVDFSAVPSLHTVSFVSCHFIRCQFSSGQFNITNCTFLDCSFYDTPRIDEHHFKQTLDLKKFADTRNYSGQSHELLQFACKKTYRSYALAFTINDLFSILNPLEKNQKLENCYISGKSEKSKTVRNVSFVNVNFLAAESLDLVLFENCNFKQCIFRGNQTMTLIGASQLVECYFEPSPYCISSNQVQKLSQQLLEQCDEEYLSDNERELACPLVSSEINSNTDSLQDHQFLTKFSHFLLFRPDAVLDTPDDCDNLRSLSKCMILGSYE